MQELHLDYETFSKCNLKKHGLARYARHPSTEVLFLSYAFDREPVQVWFPDEGPMPQRLRVALTDKRIRKCAHNAQFERAITEHVLGIEVPVEQWYCSQAHAFWLSLPGDLDTLSTVLRLKDGVAKMKEGKALIKFFCIPRKPTKTNPSTRNTKHTHPEKWATFVRYGKTDVIAERAAGSKLSHFPMSAFERQLWIIDQKINERGIPFDKEYVEAALATIAVEKKRLYRKITELTGVSNPNSGAQMLPWLRKNGYPFTDLKAPSIKKATEDWDWNMTPVACDVLKLHSEVAKSSLSKFEKMIDIEVDGLLYYTMQFAGAGRTARWAGRAIQPQNFPRPPKELEGESALLAAREAIEEGDIEFLRLLCPSPMSAIAATIRTALRAPNGKMFATCDLASIESVVIAWLAGSDKMIQVFIDNLEIYKVFAARMYGISYDAVSKRQRQLAKPGVLGAGFRLSGGMEIGKYPETKKTGLWGYAESMGIEMTQAEAKAIVTFFREEYVEIVELWYALERAVEKCIDTGEPQKVGPIVMDMKTPFLRMRLPSGRYLHYLRPVMKWKKVQVGIDKATGKPKFKSKRGFTYEGYVKNKKWGRIDSHGGKIVENLVQAIARELLAAGMVRAWEEDLDIRMHVHDEIVALVDRKLAKIKSETLHDAMVVKPDWWGKRVPLRAKPAPVEFYQK